MVSCEEKQQVYCKLCSVKLTSSSDYHLISLDHWKKYVVRAFKPLCSVAYEAVQKYRC